MQNQNKSALINKLKMSIKVENINIKKPEHIKFSMILSI